MTDLLVDLYAFGNAVGVKGPRPLDFGSVSDNDLVGPYAPSTPMDQIPGSSAFVDPHRAHLTGCYYVLPGNAELPAGLGIHADGEDSGGLAPWGHRTIYPTTPMQFSKFRELILGLPWQRAGKVG